MVCIHGGGEFRSMLCEVNKLLVVVVVVCSIYVVLCEENTFLHLPGFYSVLSCAFPEHMYSKNLSNKDTLGRYKFGP